MKKHNIYLFTIIGVLILLGAFYWFQVGAIQIRKEALVNKIKCNEEGWQLSEKIEKGLPEGASYLDPEFRFIDELNTCLFAGSWLRKDYQYTLIKDVYTNEQLFSYLIIGDKEDPLVGSKKNYELFYNKYFSK